MEWAEHTTIDFLGMMAFSKLSTAESSLPDLPPESVHPSSKFVFPKLEFGNK